jgi:hypothetical protein
MRWEGAEDVGFVMFNLFASATGGRPVWLMTNHEPWALLLSRGVK